MRFREATAQSEIRAEQARAEQAQIDDERLIVMTTTGRRAADRAVKTSPLDAQRQRLEHSWPGCTRWSWADAVLPQSVATVSRSGWTHWRVPPPGEVRLQVLYFHRTSSANARAILREGFVIDEGHT